MGRETDRRVRAPFPPRHEVLPPQEKTGAVLPALPCVIPRDGRLCRQSQRQPSSPRTGPPVGCSGPPSPGLRTPARRMLHPSIERVPVGHMGLVKGPLPSESSSIRWSIIIHAGLGGRWLFGPENIFGGKRFTFGPRCQCPLSTWSGYLGPFRSFHLPPLWEGTGGSEEEEKGESRRFSPLSDFQGSIS